MYIILSFGDIFKNPLVLLSYIKITIVARSETLKKKILILHRCHKDFFKNLPISQMMKNSSSIEYPSLSPVPTIIPETIETTAKPRF